MISFILCGTKRNRNRRAAIETQKEYPQPLRQHPPQYQGDGCCGCIFGVVFLVGGVWVFMHLLEWLAKEV